MLTRSDSRVHTILLAFVATLVLATNLVPAAAQSKRPITHEDVWLMKRVGPPAPSPDGRFVVFSVLESAYDEKDQVSDLWIVPADGSARPRRLTFSKSAESGVAWSPDSRKIAFAARREGDEASQIYVLDVVGGGEAMRVTSLSTGARGPQWRPDGRALLFISNVYPGALDDEANKKIAAERRAQKYKARVYDSFPVRHWDKWLDDLQPHVFVQSLDNGARAKDLLAGTKLVAEPGFSGMLGNSGPEMEAVWSPDGASVLFVATKNRNASAYAEVGSQIFQVSASGGEPRALTPADGEYGRLKFSPNGKALYFAFQPNTGKVYNLTRLAAINWPVGGERKIVTSSFDRSVSTFAFAPDGGTIYLTAEDAGFEKVYALPAGGGDVKPVLTDVRGAYTGLAIPAKAATTMLIANWESATNPAEVVRVDLVAKRHQALSDFNAARTAAIDWQPLREFTFTSKRGKPIHNFIALPPNFDENKKYPLFVVIHGGAASMWRDQFFTRWNYHLLAQPGYVVLLTDYTGSTGYGEKFAQDIQGDPLKGPGEEINEAADEAIKRFKFVDGTRQAAGGASYGGHLANWLEATTTRYKCIIAHAGLVNLESQWGTSDGIYHREIMNGGPVWEQGNVWREQNPIRYAGNFKTPILLTVGENDFRVPLNQTLENWSALQRMRVPSRLIVFPEENHWISRGENSRFWYGEVHAWLKKYLSVGE